MRFITKLIPVRGRKEENTRNFLHKCDNHLSPTKTSTFYSGMFTQAPCAHVKQFRIPVNSMISPQNRLTCSNHENLTP